MAQDEAGNQSEVKERKFNYDYIPPTVTINRKGGAFNQPVDVILSASEPATIFYTLDGRIPDEKSAVYKDKITITRSGSTTLLYRAVDIAGNRSSLYRENYYIDIGKPIVHARVEGETFGTDFRIILTSNKPGVRIFTKSISPIPL